MNHTSAVPSQPVAASFWQAFFMASKPTSFVFGSFSLSFETILYWMLWLFVQCLIMTVSLILIGVLGSCPSVYDNSQLIKIIETMRNRPEHTHEDRENMVRLHFKQVVGYGCSCLWIFLAPHFARLVVPSHYLMKWVLFPLSTLEMIYLFDDFICKAQAWGSSRRAMAYFGITLGMAHYVLTLAVDIYSENH